MLVESIALFFSISILFYCLFAGADFGAGILGLFTRGQNDQQELIVHAMGPVWEANHMWLILAIVILFNGFPKAYSALSIQFHIPLVVMLIGIVLRGCAFTFRHYDAIQDYTQRYYTRVFIGSSVLSPLMLGVVAGASILGYRPSSSSFYEFYVAPWLNGFCFSVGAFTCVLFSFLASVYLIGETEKYSLRRVFVKRAQVLNMVAVLSGGAVFAFAEYDGFPLINRFLSDPVSLASMSAATLILIPLWNSLKKHQIVESRIYAVAQVIFILLGWFKLQFPIILAGGDFTRSGSLTIYNSAAGTETLKGLLYALIVGSMAIFPSLAFLLRVFKVSNENPSR